MTMRPALPCEASRSCAPSRALIDAQAAAGQADQDGLMQPTAADRHGREPVYRAEGRRRGRAIAPPILLGHIDDMAVGEHRAFEMLNSSA